MADHGQADQQPLDNLTSLAAKAESANSATTALKMAAAADQLAEARAWLNQTNQPHGGFAYSDGGQ